MVCSWGWSGPGGVSGPGGWSGPGGLQFFGRSQIFWGVSNFSGGSPIFQGVSHFSGGLQFFRGSPNFRVGGSPNFCQPLPDTVNERPVHILLECILVLNEVTHKPVLTQNKKYELSVFDYKSL